MDVVLDLQSQRLTSAQLDARLLNVSNPLALRRLYLSNNELTEIPSCNKKKEKKKTRKNFFFCFVFLDITLMYEFLKLYFFIHALVLFLFRAAHRLLHFEAHLLLLQLTRPIPHHYVSSIPNAQSSAQALREGLVPKKE